MNAPALAPLNFCKSVEVTRLLIPGTAMPAQSQTDTSKEHYTTKHYLHGIMRVFWRWVTPCKTQKQHPVQTEAEVPRGRAPVPAAHLSAGAVAPAQLWVKSNPTLHLPLHLWGWSSSRSCWDSLHKTIYFDDLTDFYAIFYTFTMNSKTLLGFLGKRFVNYIPTSQTLS